jgi:hypothetical protein
MKEPARGPWTRMPMACTSAFLSVLMCQLRGPAPSAFSHATENEEKGKRKTYWSSSQTTHPPAVHRRRLSSVVTNNEMGRATSSKTLLSSSSSSTNYPSASTLKPAPCLP